MELEEQDALLGMWLDFLDGQRPTAVLMREFYFEVVFHSAHYRYGMAPEVFDLLINGPFRADHSRLWESAYRTSRDHRAA